MKVFELYESWDFKDGDPRAEAVYSDNDGRALRFALRPGQKLQRHRSPHSPVYIVVLHGSGEFTGGDGATATCGPGTMLVFDSGEEHEAVALDDDLVFIAIFHGARHRDLLEDGGEDHAHPRKDSA